MQERDVIKKLNTHLSAIVGLLSKLSEEKFIEEGQKVESFLRGTGLSVSEISTALGKKQDTIRKALTRSKKYK